ncbi:methylamine utilization protein [Rhodanobacter aciditrophus]|uniref:Methylamine utilization protein n=1 Tax=Rhodanobacter aciditrophus TaxID=1623218 RepID=A0ABW4AW37_9GAMM
MVKGRIVSALCACAMSSSIWAADIQITVLGSGGEPLENAVVFLKSDALIKQAKPQTGVTMAQQDRAFIPGLQVVTKGSAISFPNQDDVRHHVYSFSPAKTFELKLYIGKPKDPVVFDQEGIVELGCNIHDTMLAWVLVTNTSVYGKTDANGLVTFSGQPSDTYDVDVWHRSFPYGAPFETAQVALGKTDVTQTIRLDSGSSF